MKRMTAWVGLIASIGTIHTYVVWLCSSHSGTVAASCFIAVILAAACILWWGDR